MKDSLNAHDEHSLKKIKCNYRLKQIFNYIKEKKLLEIIKYNNNLQTRLNININNYIDYYNKIVIEIIPLNKNDKNEFINIPKQDEPSYHIFFNDDKNETKRNYFKKDEKVSKIKIIIDTNVKSLKNLFKCCKNIEKINFIKFNRKDIDDMSSMFYECSSLKELVFNNFHTDNVKNMRYMFIRCFSLKKLNLNNFNTAHVTDMSCMFYECSSLNELILNNFNTNNVKNMRYMFYYCTSLKDLNLENFNINKETKIDDMFLYCSDELIMNIKNKYKNIAIIISSFEFVD